jgi:hypothetical protein
MNPGMSCSLALCAAVSAGCATSDSQRVAPDTGTVDATIGADGNGASNDASRNPPDSETTGAADTGLPDVGSDACGPIAACPPSDNCGSVPDGCGGNADCGSGCPPGQTCGGGGTPNVCGAMR